MKKASSSEATAKKHQADSDFKGRYHNLETPCCDVARTTISKIIRSLNSSSTSEPTQSETKSKASSTTARPPPSASCLTVLTIREIALAAEKETAGGSPEGISAKKKKKRKKKKKQSEKESGNDIENAKSGEIEDAERDEAATVNAGSSHAALVSSVKDSPDAPTASVCKTNKTALTNDEDGKLAGTAEIQMSASSCLSMLFPSGQEPQIDDMIKESYAKRSLSDFLFHLSDSTIDRGSASMTPNAAGVTKKKDAKARQRLSSGLRVGLPSHMSTPSFGTLKEVHQHVDTIHCKVCKRNCLEMLARLLDNVHRGCEPAQELCSVNDMDAEVSLLPTYPTKDGLAWASDSSAGDLSSNGLSQSSNVGLNEEVRNSSPISNSSELAEESEKARKFSVKLFLHSKSKEPLKGYHQPEYDSVLLLLPPSVVPTPDGKATNRLSSGTAERCRDEVDAFVHLFSNSLLPLGYDSSFSANNSNLSEPEDSSGKKKEKTNNPKKLEHNNPFLHLKWNKEIYSGQLFASCSPAAFVTLEESFDSQHRLAHLDLQFKDLVEKRKTVISNLNQIRNESDSVSSSRQEVGFRQGALLRGVDNELHGLFGKMTALLIDITKIVFCTYVTRADVSESNARPVQTDELETNLVQGSFLNPGRSAEIQKASKDLWISYDKVLWRYTSHALQYRGEQMYGWQYGESASSKFSVNGGFQDASVVLGSSAPAPGDTEAGSAESAPRMTFVPQLFHNPYLRSRFSHMLERQLDEVNIFFRELEFFFRLYLKDVACWAEHHRRLIPELPPFNGAEEQLALLRLGLALTINRGTVHEVKSEQSERDHNLRELAFTKMDDLLERECARVLELVNTAVTEGRSCVSQEELQGIHEWKKNFEEETRTIRMKIKACTEEMKADMKKAIGTRDAEGDNNWKGPVTEGSIKKQHNAFQQTTTIGLKFSNSRVSLTLARWRLISQFYAQYYHVKLLIESRKNSLRGHNSNFGHCGHENGARRRIAGIVGSLLYKWLDQRCSEWNADEMQRELLEGFEASFDNNSTTNGPAGAKVKKKKKKDSGRTMTSPNTHATKADVISKSNGDDDSEDKESFATKEPDIGQVDSNTRAAEPPPSISKDNSSKDLAKEQVNGQDEATCNDLSAPKDKTVLGNEKYRTVSEERTILISDAPKETHRKVNADLEQETTRRFAGSKRLSNQKSDTGTGTTTYHFLNDLKSASYFLISKVNWQTMSTKETPAKIVFL